MSPSETLPVFQDAAVEVAGATVASKSRTERIAVIGLGYVGLPLCIAMARRFEDVLGYDVSTKRILDLKEHRDKTGEIDEQSLKASSAMFSTDDGSIAKATFFIVTVPTPIDAEKRPDLTPLRAACEMIGRHLKRNDVVVFESTVYPGVTEDFCGPILEHVSGLKAGVDFNLAYSPERINPGDRERRFEAIIKVVSADSEQALDRVASVYELVVHAGVFRARSIRVAECAKVIENTQRDVNIALMNELSLICDRVGISTRDVIEAAETKWNFMKFRPGLVGGHCIGVDPYYLSSIAERHKLHPEVILAGRRTNDKMAAHVAAKAVKALVRRDGRVADARVGVFGMTFKENVPDIRNSKSIDLVNELRALGLTVMIHDPQADPDELARVGIMLDRLEAMDNLDMMIVAVAHAAYIKSSDFLTCLQHDGVFFDIRGMFQKEQLPAEATYWAL